MGQIDPLMLVLLMGGNMGTMELMLLWMMGAFNRPATGGG